MKHSRLIATIASAVLLLSTSAFADDPGAAVAVPDAGAMFPAVLATLVGMAFVAKRFKKR